MTVPPWSWARYLGTHCSVVLPPDATRSVFEHPSVFERAFVVLAFAAVVSAGLWMRSSGSRAPARLDRFSSAVRAELSVGSDAVMAVILLIAVLTGIGTVAFAADLSGGSTGDNGYTELSLLTEDENGTLVATDYPTEYRRGESGTVYVSVGNREGATREYTLIAKLQRIDKTGESTVVQEETELGRWTQQVRDGETVRFEHDVRPEMTGSNLRLVYLLYRGQPPEDPTTDNAYRSVHLRIDVTANRSVNR